MSLSCPLAPDLRNVLLLSPLQPHRQLHANVLAEQSRLHSRCRHIHHRYLLNCRYSSAANNSSSSSQHNTNGKDEDEPADLTRPFQEMHVTPKKQLLLTPMKTLPFSPSQFLNGSALSAAVAAAEESAAVMSTPVGPSAPKPSAALTPVRNAFRTPLRGGNPPFLVTRTPTPFKDALAEMEKKGGPINYVVRQFDPLHPFFFYFVTQDYP